MAIRFQCSACHAKLKVGSHKAGARKKCPLCGEEIQIPLEDSAEGSSSGTSTSSGSPSESQSTESESEDEELYLDAPVIDASRIRVDRSAAPAGPHRVDAPLTLPRRVVYALGGLIVVVAVFFFMFGVLVGRISVRRDPEVAAARPNRVRCVVSGSVHRRENNQRLADEGSIVILVPQETTPDVRPSGGALHPIDGTGPESPDADLIRTFGGEVVRVDAQGRFRATLVSGKTYDLLVVSKNVASSSAVSRDLRALWGRVFVPLEPVLQGRAVAHRTLIAKDTAATVPAIVIN